MVVLNTWVTHNALSQALYTLKCWTRNKFLTRSECIAQCYYPEEFLYTHTRKHLYRIDIPYFE